MGARGRVLWLSLLGIAGLAVMLALESARTARDHRATSEQVMADYTALGAEGLANRLQSFLAGRLFAILGATTQPLPDSPQRLAEDLGAGAALFAGQVAWVGLVDGDRVSSRTFGASAGPPRDLPAALAAQTRSLPDVAYIGLLALGGELVTFAPLRSGAPAAAFAIPLAALPELLAQFLARDPILPSSLTRGTSLDTSAWVRIAMGGTTIATRGDSLASPFLASHSLGPVFGDMSVQVQLAGALAPTLVIGGLPRSRLPFLGAVLLLTLGLAVAAVIQIRQQDRLARLREEFVTGASHELRTPLAQIRLFAETLRLGRVRNEEERQRAIAVVEREARRLEHLVDNLLHFTRGAAAPAATAPAHAEVDQLTREIVADFAPLAAKAGAAVELAESPGATRTLVDPVAWRQIVQNLLDNGVKYGGPSGRVAVQLETTAERVRLVVSDQGPGVAPGDRARIWDRFWRSDAARSSDTQGAGIGLATVRDLVRRQGGACWVEENRPQGARFVVELPGDRCAS